MSSKRTWDPTRIDWRVQHRTGPVTMGWVPEMQCLRFSWEDQHALLSAGMNWVENQPWLGLSMEPISPEGVPKAQKILKMLGVRRIPEHPAQDPLERPTWGTEDFSEAAARTWIGIIRKLQG